MSSTNTNTNPEIERHLEELTAVCCQSLRGSGQPADEVVDQLLKSLLMSGFARMERPSLQRELERRMKAGPDDKALHHAEQVLAITRAVQRKFDALKLWHSKHPPGDSNGHQPVAG